SVFAAMGVMITSATVIIVGASNWDPVQLVARFSSPIVVAVAMFTAVVATLAVNIAANVVSPANDFANAFPRLVSFKTGGLVAGILGIAIPRIPATRPPVLKLTRRGNAFAKSFAGETTLAAMLTASVATTAVNIATATTIGELKRATSCTGSQLDAPTMMTVALVIITPIAAKTDIVVGSART